MRSHSPPGSLQRSRSRRAHSSTPSSFVDAIGHSGALGLLAAVCLVGGAAVLWMLPDEGQIAPRGAAPRGAAPPTPAAARQARARATTRGGGGGRERGDATHARQAAVEPVDFGRVRWQQEAGSSVFTARSFTPASARRTFHEAKVPVLLASAAMLPAFSPPSSPSSSPDRLTPRSLCLPPASAGR